MNKKPVNAGGEAFSRPLRAKQGAGPKRQTAKEQLEVIRTASREINFGRITVSFTGEPSNVVDIVAEKHIRFQRRKMAAPATGEPGDRRDAGRIVRDRPGPFMPPYHLADIGNVIGRVFPAWSGAAPEEAGY